MMSAKASLILNSMKFLICVYNDNVVNILPFLSWTMEC